VEWNIVIVLVARVNHIRETARCMFIGVKMNRRQGRENKIVRDIKLTSHQIELFRSYRYITHWLIDHAIQCDNKQCICRASTFEDELPNLERIDIEYARTIREVLDKP